MADKVTDDRGASGTTGEDEFEFAFDGAAEEKDEGVESGQLGTDFDEDEDLDELETEISGDAGTSAEAGTSGVVSEEEEQPDIEEQFQKSEQRYRTLQGILKHDKEEWETEKTQLVEQLDKLKSGASEETEIDAEQEEKAQAFIDSLTEEQKAQLAEYDKDFETVSKMEGIKRSIALDGLRKEIASWKDEVTAKLTEHDSKLTPVVEFTEDAEANIHARSIKDAHKDFEQFRDDGSILKWIEAKPRYLQTTLLNVYEKGEAEDVIELITDFKTENNIQTATDDTTDTEDTERADELARKKAEKKAALQSVETRVASVDVGKTHSDDFEGAFDEAVNRRT